MPLCELYSEKPSVLFFVHVYHVWCLLCCHRCLVEVNERIESLKQPDERDDQPYDDHALFKQEHDEQLLLWTQRYGKECQC